MNLNASGTATDPTILGLLEDLLEGNITLDEMLQ
jgi:hypothetical protein